MVTLLIVGAGSRGSTFADWARRHPSEARVVAVAEPRAVYRDRLGDAHDVPSTHRFADWREAVAHGRVADAVVIATLDRDHTEPALAFAEQGYAMLLEKPMAPTEEECREIVGAVERAGIVAAVATCCATRRTRARSSGCSTTARSARSSASTTSSRSASGTRRTRTCAATGAARTRPGRCCSPSPATTSTGCRTWSSSRAAPCRRSASLAHFRRDRRPDGAGDRCLDCAIEPDCPFSARRLYLGMAERGETGWPVDVVALADRRPSNVERALRDGPYGRCVYACDNDVVDHQVVNLRVRERRHRELHDDRVHAQRDRETRIFGTRGELYGERRHRRGPRLPHRETTMHDTSSTATTSAGHGGGDAA